jgi:hypothetical protein
MGRRWDARPSDGGSVGRIFASVETIAPVARCPLRPAWCLRVSALESLPVRASGCEDIDDDGAIRARVDLVRRVRRDAPRSAWAQLANLAADPKGERSLEDDAELLVLVAVLWDYAPWIELDYGKAEAITFHGASENAFPDSKRMSSREIVERAHAVLLGHRGNRIHDDRESSLSRFSIRLIVSNLTHLIALS